MKIELYYHHATISSGRTQSSKADDPRQILEIAGVVRLFMTYADLYRVRFLTIEEARAAAELTGWEFWYDDVLVMPVVAGEGLIHAPKLNCYYSDMMVSA